MTRTSTVLNLDLVVIGEPTTTEDRVVKLEADNTILKATVYDLQGRVQLLENALLKHQPVRNLA